IQAYGITAIVAQCQQNAHSILDIATLVLCVFYATPTLGFYKSEEKTSIYLLQVPHQDFNKGCDIAKIINDCSLIHLSRIFVLWQFISEWMLLNVAIIFHRKMIKCDKYHILTKV